MTRKVAAVAQRECDRVDGLDNWAIYDQVQCPTLLIRGSLRFIIGGDGTRNDETGPKAELVVIEGRARANDEHSATNSDCGRLPSKGVRIGPGQFHTLLFLLISLSFVARASEIFCEDLLKMERCLLIQ